MKLSKLAWSGGCALTLLLTAPAAMAQDATVPPPGKSAGDFIIRLRGIGVIPRDNADIEPIGGDTDLENTAARDRYQLFHHRQHRRGGDRRHHQP